MSEKPKLKRSWFRFHLSTAIILMFGAGGLLWMNSLQRIIRGPTVSILSVTSKGWLECGWPFTVSRTEASIIEEFEDIQKNRKTMKIATELNSKPTTLFPNVFLNGLVGVAILFGVAFPSEFLIRRREARKK